MKIICLYVPRTLMVCMSDNYNALQAGGHKIWASGLLVQDVG